MTTAAYRPRQHPDPIPPSPEELFELWLDDVYPILKETWLAGYAARFAMTPERTRSSSRVPRQPSPVQDTMSPYPQNSSGQTWELPNDQMPAGWRKVFHLRGEAPCRKAAMILTRPLHVGEKVLPQEVLRTINGNLVSADDIPLCGYCGFEFYELHSNRDLDWAPHLLVDNRPKTVTFADEYTPSPAGNGTYQHPIDAMDRMESSLSSPLVPEEILNEVQPLIIEQEEAALRELGERLQVYTRDIPDVSSEASE